MKKFILGFLCAMFLFGAITIVAASERSIVPNVFPIFVNGEQRDVAAYNIDGSTFVGLRSVAELIDGVEVDFVDGNIVINSIDIDGTERVLGEGALIVVVGGAEYVMMFSMSSTCNTYRLGFDHENQNLFIAEMNEHFDVVNVIVDNIPFRVYQYRTVIPLTFFNAYVGPILLGE